MRPKAPTTSQAVPPKVVEALSQFSALASRYEREAKCAQLVGDSRARDELLGQAFEVRFRTAALAESLIEGESAPFLARQLDFRRSLGRLQLTCAILAIRLGDWRSARDHDLRALHFDRRLEPRVLSLLVTADVSEVD